jgi:hypothetical protein
LTVKASDVVALEAPLVPVTIRLLVPTGAEVLAASVTVVEAVDDEGLNVAVTPAGAPVRANKKKKN